MSNTEIKNKILELSISFKDANTDLEDAEIIEYSVLKMIAEYILSNNLNEGNYSNSSEWTSDKLRYLVDSTSVKNGTILDLNWAFKNSFWTDEFESKADYLEMLNEMLQNRDVFYNLEEDF